MSETFWISILIGIVCLGVVVGIIWFGKNILERKYLDHPVWDNMIFHCIEKQHPYNDIPRQIAESYADYLQRRNEFWTTYGQVILAIFIVAILSILLLMRVISAEAGLPILSGISGFAIAKGVSGSKTISIPQNKPQ